MRRKYVHCPLKVSCEGSAEWGSGTVVANTAVYFLLNYSKAQPLSWCPACHSTASLLVPAEHSFAKVQEF